MTFHSTLHGDKPKRPVALQREGNGDHYGGRKKASGLLLQRDAATVNGVIHTAFDHDPAKRKQGGRSAPG